MFRSLLIFSLLGGLTTTAHAECSCLWGGPFTRVQAQTDLVVVSTVRSGKGNSIDLQLDQILRGEEHLDDVRLWLDTGELCRASVDTFAPGTRWVMALSQIEDVPEGGFNPNTPNISYGRRGDYSLSRCGGYWLKLEHNMVTGNLAAGPRWERSPDMSPVLLELVTDFVEGTIDEAALQEASRTDPALQRLKLDTRSFLREQGNPLLTTE